MVEITINNKTYKMPETMAIDTWSAILKWDFEDPKHWPRIVGTAIGCNPLLLQNADEESLELAIIFIATSVQKRVKVACKDFNTLTFGEFVDLEVYLTYGLDKHIKDIMKILDADCQDVAQALWLIDRYVEFRNYTYRQYSTLFGLNDPTDPDEEAEAADPLVVAKSWYKIIVGLAGDNILNIDDVTDQPLKKALNFMALEKEKQLEEEQRLLKQKRQHDLQTNRR